MLNIKLHKVPDANIWILYNSLGGQVIATCDTINGMALIARAFDRKYLDSQLWVDLKDLPY